MQGADPLAEDIYGDTADILVTRSDYALNLITEAKEAAEKAAREAGGE